MHPNTKYISIIEFTDGIKNTQTLNCIIPISQKEGFNNYTKVPKNIGMLFYFPSRDISITTKDMNEGLYLISIDEYKVKEILKVDKGVDLIELEGRYLIEVSLDNPIVDKIKKGYKVKFISKQKMKNSNKKYRIVDSKGQKINSNIDYLKFGGAERTEATMKNYISFLLDENSTAQMRLEGDERIFSRKHTKQLINLIKKPKTKSNIYKLGELVKDIINIHSTQKKQYVKD